MDTAQWQTFAKQIPHLSHRQRIVSSNLLQSSAPQDAAVALIEQTGQAQLHCPACYSTPKEYCLPKACSGPLWVRSHI